MEKIRKYILLVFTGFLLFIVLLVLLYPFWFPKGKIISYLEQEVGRSLGAKIRIGDFKFSSASDVVITQVEISKVKGDNKPFLICESIGVSFNPLMLQKKRIHTISLISPRISLVQDINGNWNYPVSEGEPFEGLIDKISFIHAIFNFSVPGFRTRVEPLDFTLKSYGRGLKSNFSFKGLLIDRKSVAEGKGEISFSKERTDLSFKINTSSLPFQFLPQGLRDYIIPENGVISGKLYLSGSANLLKEIYQARFNSSIQSLRLKTFRGEIFPINADITGGGTYNIKESRLVNFDLKTEGLQLSTSKNLFKNNIVSNLSGSCEANLSTSENTIYSELELNNLAAKIRIGESSFDFNKNEISLKAKGEYNKESGNIKVPFLTVKIDRFGKLVAEGNISGLGTRSPKLDLKFNVSPIPVSRVRDFLIAKRLFRFKELKVSGISEAKGTISGSLKEPRIEGVINIRDGEMDSNIIKVSGISSLIPFSFEKDSLKINPLELTFNSISTGRRGEKEIFHKGAKLILNLSFNPKKGTLIGDNLNFTIPSFGGLSGYFMANLKDMKLLEGKIESSSINLKKSKDEFGIFLPSHFTPYFNNIKIYGDMVIGVEVKDMNLKNPLLNSQISSKVHLQEVGLESEDGSGAINGIKGSVSLKIFPGDLRKNLEAEVKAKFSDFELLLNQLYASFKDRELEVDFGSNYEVEKSELFLSNGNVTFPGVSSINFSGQVNTSKAMLKGNISSKSINNKNLLELLKNSLKENYPILSEINIDGESQIDLAVNGDLKKLDLIGKAKIKGTDISINGKDFMAKGIEGDIPFSLFYPAQKISLMPGINFDESEIGMIKFGELSFGAMKLDNQSYKILIKNNSLYIKDDMEIPLFNGKLNISGFHFSDVFNPSQKFECSLRLDNIDLAEVSKNYGLDYDGGKIEGKVSGTLDRISVVDGRLKVQGAQRAIKADVFNGTVVLYDFKGTEVFSDFRTIGFSSDIKDIDLNKATKSLDVGLMTGILSGSVRDIIIFDGLPTSFELDLESVPKKGVKQMISTDAIKNISILGSGIAGALERGVSQYKYQKFGLYSRLKDDKLTLRGKIHKRGKEYFLTGWGLTGFRLTKIAIVNTFPEATIHFKDLVERLKRIKRAWE